VSSEPSAIIDGPLALRRGLAEIRDCQEDLQSFSAGAVEQLKACAAELLRRQRSWLAERSEIQRDLDRREEACRRRRAELIAEWEELARARQDLALAREALRRRQDEAVRLAPPASAPTADVGKLLRELEAERRREIEELQRLVEAVRAMRLESAKPWPMPLEMAMSSSPPPAQPDASKKNSDRRKR
jgi:predicted RNase H-like nuclease (RuvC/YqgF family)